MSKSGKRGLSVDERMAIIADLRMHVIEVSAMMTSNYGPDEASLEFVIEDFLSDPEAVSDALNAMADATADLLWAIRGGEDALQRFANAVIGGYNRKNAEQRAEMNRAGKFDAIRETDRCNSNEQVGRLSAAEPASRAIN